MKFTINVDCTPQEARQFFGLPDVGPMQEQMLKEMQDKMKQNLSAMEPEAMMKLWFPASVQGFGDLQKMMWEQMSSMMPGAGTGGTKSGGRK